MAIPSYLTRQADGSYTSPGGLVYGDDLSFGNRAAHVLSHLEESAEKASQGVFTVPEAEVFPLVDEAFGRLQQDPSRYHSEDQGKRQAYNVPVGRPIGYVGGQEGSQAQVSTLRIVLEGEHDLVTAFPVEP
ncbi:MAG: hypothetical protein ABIO70_22445 [Pseudomonadota bacterium]